jgi:hypothetical protein
LKLLKHTITVLARLIVLCCALIVISAGLLYVFGVSNEPELNPGWTMTQADVVRARKILREGSRTKPDETGKIVLSHADLNLAANYLLNHFGAGRALVALKSGKIRFAVTAVLPESRLGKYVNISFRLGNEDGSRLPVLTKFKAGKLLLPSKVAAFVIDKLIKHSFLKEYFILATEPIESIQIDEDKITIVYHQNQSSLIAARDILTHSTTATNGTSVYESKLKDIVRHHDPEWRLSLAELLKPLFALAYQRSSLETAVEENRAVIYAVNAYVNNKKPLADQQTTTYPAFLYKRIDLAQHFIGAAAITASVNSQIAQVMGEEKEIRDSKIGSGFSFVDLAADRAGTRFGEMAVGKPQSARKLQERMANINDYTDFMPDPRALPEHMNEADFKQRYGKINSEAYLKVSRQIDELIASTPVYRK